MIQITESPRDAMQGIKEFIPTETKVDYINKLFSVGFDMIDIGSFVSARAVPQMLDSAEVLERIDADKINCKISLLVGNARYAEQASQIDIVDYINYPFSVSEIFLGKNLKSDFEKSYREIDRILHIAEAAGKEVIITVSSAFGNPYGEKWDTDLLKRHIENLMHRGMRYIPLADTTSEADAERLQKVYASVSECFPEAVFNVHLHTYSEDMTAKADALYAAGCRSFDTVFNGMGGCPMSGRKMIANVNTADFLKWADSRNISHKLNHKALTDAALTAASIFG